MRLPLPHAAFTLLIGCTQAPTGESSLPSAQQRHQAFIELRKLAKHGTQGEIRVDDIGWDDFAAHYTAVDSASFSVLWPDSIWVAGLEDYDRTYVHGWKELDQDHVLLSLITQRENSYCTTIVLDLRTREGRSLCSFEAASRCGDGNWTYMAHGRFEDPWTYIRTSVEMDLATLDSNYVETYSCDSLVSRISFSRNGELTEERISATHFEVVEHPQLQD